MSGGFGIPDLASRRTKEYWNEEICDVESRVYANQSQCEPIASIALDRTEDSKDQQENGQLGEEQREAVERVRIIVELRALSDLPRKDSIFKTYPPIVLDVLVHDVPLMCASTMVTDAEKKAEKDHERRLNYLCQKRAYQAMTAILLASMCEGPSRFLHTHPSTHVSGALSKNIPSAGLSPYSLPI